MRLFFWATKTDRLENNSNFARNLIVTYHMKGNKAQMLFAAEKLKKYIWGHLLQYAN